MSYVVDSDPKSWRSNVENASTLFEKPVPVKIRTLDKEERVEELVIRILMGVHKGQHGAKASFTFIDNPLSIMRYVYIVYEVVHGCALLCI